MSKIAKLGWILAAALAVVVVVEAQQATEKYIPIGYSPGISNKYSHVGTIKAVSSEERTITVQDATGTYTFEVTPVTRIYLDRSQATKTNLAGRWEDCQVGQRVEVMYQHDNKSIADWIKLKLADR